MNLYAYAIASAAIAGLGATLWHWAPFVGPQVQFEEKDAKIATLTAALATERETVKLRDKEIEGRDALLKANGETATAEAERLASSCKLTCKGAFDAGYASRRCPAGGAPDPGVRDLRSAQAAGAFKARPGGVPSQPPGGDRQ